MYAFLIGDAAADVYHNASKNNAACINCQHYEQFFILTIYASQSWLLYGKAYANTSGKMKTVSF